MIEVWISILTDDKDEIRNAEILESTNNRLEYLEWGSKIVTVHGQKYYEYYREPIFVLWYKICIFNEIYMKIADKNTKLFYYHGYCCDETTRESIEPLANLSDKFIGVDIKDITRLRDIWDKLNCMTKIGSNKYVLKLDCVRTLTRKLRQYCSIRRDIKRTLKLLPVLEQSIT